MFRVLLGLLVAGLTASVNAIAVGPLLQSEITWEAVDADSSLPQVPENTQMRLIATVRNIGAAANAAGRIYIEFSPKEDARGHAGPPALFQTESQRLPAITPGQSIRFAFARLHRWPSLAEFMRHDWPKQRYKAVVHIRGVTAVTGLAAISYQAHYIPSSAEQQAQPFPEAPRLSEHPRSKGASSRSFPYP